MINWGTVPAGSVLPFPFAAYGGTNGESITITGLATGDIEVYKGTSMTQRASDNGYALMDTDGIDIDSRTGINGFSIDTGDNTDAGFYAVGSFFWVVVDAITVDSQTVRMIAGTWRLGPAESSAGVPKVDVSHLSGSALTVTTGTVTTDGSNSATSFETDLSQTTNDYWKDAYIVLTSGVLAGQVKRITAYNGTTKFVTVAGGFTGTPADGVTFAIVNR